MTALAAALIAVALAAGADDSAPMTNEDVVRMTAEGKPVEDLLDAVRTRRVAFDL